MTTVSTALWADRFLFISGRVCLDFAHTGGAGDRKQFERLHSPADLARWFAKSSLQLTQVTISESDMSFAFNLREAIWHVAQAARMHAPWSAAHVNILNKAAAAELPVPQLTSTAKKVVRKPVSARAAFSVIARDAIDLLTSSNEIKECANPVCHLLFVDKSHASKRRWCAMQRCGTLTKVMRFRNKNN